MEAGAGEPKERGVNGLDIVAWDDRRWWEGDTFLLKSPEDFTEGEAGSGTSSSERVGVCCLRCFFQFCLARRTFSSDSSLS